MEYRTRMYHLLELYAKPYDPEEPVLCVDEKSKQLIAQVRTPLRLKLGRDTLEDYEYQRRGTRNLFVCVEPQAGRRVVKVTNHRKKEDFVQFVRELSEIHYPHTRKIHLVLDNLNTHFEKCFEDVLPAVEAQALLSRIVFHHTPKHASWLNMAELEIGILDRQGIKGRIGTQEELKRRTDALVERRNAKCAKIHWTFTREKADEKLKKHYV